MKHKVWLFPKIKILRGNKTKIKALLQVFPSRSGCVPDGPLLTVSFPIGYFSTFLCIRQIYPFLALFWCRKEGIFPIWSLLIHTKEPLFCSGWDFSPYSLEVNDPFFNGTEVALVQCRWQKSKTECVYLILFHEHFVFTGFFFFCDHGLCLLAIFLLLKSHPWYECWLHCTLEYAVQSYSSLMCMLCCNTVASLHEQTI